MLARHLPPFAPVTPHIDLTSSHQCIVEHAANMARSPLAFLNTAEAAITARKAAIRNFGAGWIRPPGVCLTLEAMRDREMSWLERKQVQRRHAGLGIPRAAREMEEIGDEPETWSEGEEAGSSSESEREEMRNIVESNRDRESISSDGVRLVGNSPLHLEVYQQETFPGEEREVAVTYLEQAGVTGAVGSEEDLVIDYDVNTPITDASTNHFSNNSSRDTDNGNDGAFGQDSSATAQFSRPSSTQYLEREASGTALSALSDRSTHSASASVSFRESHIHAQGGSLLPNSSARMQPILHMSIPMPYSLPKMTSGLR